MAADCWVAFGKHSSKVLLIVAVFFKLFVYGANRDTMTVIESDILLPYGEYQHGPQHHTHRHIRSIMQTFKFGSSAHEIFPNHQSYFVELPIVESHAFVEKIGDYYWDQRHVYGHIYRINNPHETVSILEPGKRGGCDKNYMTTVEETARNAKCIVATNAGFFNTTSGACLGDIVSDGREVLHDGQQNANFGIRKDGSLFFGYLPEELDIKAEFDQLISGVIWLVRNRENFISRSQQLEGSSTQETGSLQYFIDVKSARLAIACDSEGKLLIIQVDGHTGERGVSLNEFASLLIKFGAVNAVNLDGGGSVTAIVNGTQVNYPGDRCLLNKTDGATYEYNCARNLTTVLCVHEPRCIVENCSNHGDCINGRCLCHENWEGLECNQLQCGATNCSAHGICKEDGCHCDAGWFGDNCAEPCPDGKFGHQCLQTCHCLRGGICQKSDGACLCPPGYTGDLCEQTCPNGFYGDGCRQLCFCEDSCLCDHVTGSCDRNAVSISYWEATQCLIEQAIQERDLVPDQSKQLRFAAICLGCLAVIAGASLILNMLLLCLHYRCRCNSRKTSKQSKKRVYKSVKAPSIGDESSSDEEIAGDFNKEAAIKLQEIQYEIAKGRVDKNNLNNLNPENG